MKKIYTAPEAELMYFISAERVATGTIIDFDTLASNTGGKNGATLDLP